jgi:hypothetical protein
MLESFLFLGYLYIMQARLIQKPLKSAQDTAAQMVELVQMYSSDLGKMTKWTLPKFFRHVSQLEFRPDPPGQESIARPKITLDKSWPWRDCDDKSILIGSWLFENKVPFFFRATSKRRDGLLHHVFPVALINGRETVLDATYKTGQIGKIDKKVSNSVNLTGNIMQPTLNIFHGDEAAEMSGFFSRVKRKAKKGAIRAARVNPGVFVASELIRAGGDPRKVKLSRYEPLQIARSVNPLSGPFKSLSRKVKKVSRKAKKVGHKALSVPGVRDLVKATPAGAALLKVGKILDRKAQKITSAIDTQEAAAMEQTAQRPKWLIPAAAGAAGLVLLLAIRRK